MPKFYIAYRIDHVGETEVEANSLEEAKQIAGLDSVKADADWEMLEDVSNAEITEAFEMDDDFEW